MREPAHKPTPRPPHPATIAALRPSSPRGAAQPKTPHPATVGRPKPPHPATTAQLRSRALPAHSATIQRSCLFSWCWKSSDPYEEQTDEELLEVPTKIEKKIEKKGKSLNLMQGMSGVAHGGDTVNHLGVTGCGLVLGFGSKGVAAFHWPGMANSGGYFNTFGSVVAEVGALSRIEIYTNPTLKNDTKSETSYSDTARAIHERWEVPTTHYFYGDSVEGVDFTATIDESETGFSRLHPKVTGILIQLP